MKIDRLAKEYLSRLELQAQIAKQVSELKDMLTKVVDEQGEPDEKGHRWLIEGDVVLQRQKRQGDKYINREKAEEWAKERGIWGEVKVTREELDEDALLGFVYEHRKDANWPGLEKELEALYETPPVTYAFIKPVIQTNYDY